MDYKYKHFTETELIELMEQAKTRDVSDEESEILWSMYYERWGTGAFGRCLHPHWLLEDIKHQRESKVILEEKEEVKEWRQRAELEEFDSPNLDIPDIDLDFMCEEPSNCSSHKRLGNACDCIRQNFYSETVFDKWIDKTINELGTELKDLIPFKK